MQKTARNTPRVARAIDAGFGVVKFTRKATPEEASIAYNGVVCDSFLSVAIDAERLETAMDSGQRRDTFLVSYEGRSYEVGKGVRDNMVASDFGRDMTNEYYDSKVYHALMRGALAYMGDDVIHTLVLGLPMNHFENKGRVQKLESQYTGLIDLGHGRQVTVEKTIVHPQPLGGYISLVNDIDQINATLKNYPECGIAPLKSAKDLKALTVLIVDTGEFTLDWLLMTPSGPAHRISSAASDAGRHRILREVHELMIAKVGKPLGVSFLTDIDESLRNKKPLRVAGRSYDMTTPDVLAAIEKAVEDPVRQLFEGLRGADDRIDLVAVLGGSPDDVAAAIRRERPYLPVYCPVAEPGQNSSMFANLRGFQEWSEVVDAKKAASIEMACEA